MKGMLSPLYWLGCPLLLLPLAARADSVQIGYSNCLEVAYYSPTLMTEVGQLRWYFTHASVGGNMMDGIEDLHAMNTNFYPYQRVSEDAVPPGAAENGVIYDYDRGNPGVWPKLTIFEECVNNGWRSPLVNLVMNKFCYIDSSANADDYLDSMKTLEAAYPETLFVYATMPLTTSTGSDNYLRNVFNEAVRNWTRTNNRVLFDIADIEAHDTNGVACTFTYDDHVCQRLCDDYAADEGHLNVPGRQLAARGFYALGAALFDVDRDGDGLSDGQELIAGTCPTDNQSAFRFSVAGGTDAGGLVVQWGSVSNRIYTLERGTKLGEDSSFVRILQDVAATPPMNSCTDSPPDPGPFFYRLHVRQ